MFNSTGYTWQSYIQLRVAVNPPDGGHKEFKGFAEFQLAFRSKEPNPVKGAVSMPTLRQAVCK
jgi:hypothetical protein